MFLQMVNIERSKLSKRTMLWVEFAVVILAVLLLFGAFYGIQSADFSGAENVRVEGDLEEFAQLLVWPMGVTVGFEAFSMLGTFLLVILTGAFVAQEYSWGGFQLWLSRGVPRPSALLSKFLVVTFVTLLFVFTAVTISVLTSAIFSQVNLGSIPFDSVNWVRLMQSILLISFSLLPYVAITFFIAVLSRSTVVAVAGALAFALLIETILTQIGMLAGGVWQEIIPFLPSNLGQSVSQIILEIPILDDLPNLVETGGNILSLETAVLVITAYIILFMAGSLFVFQKQDLGG